MNVLSIYLLTGKNLDVKRQNGNSSVQGGITKKVPQDRSNPTLSWSEVPIPHRRF